MHKTLCSVILAGLLAGSLVACPATAEDSVPIRTLDRIAAGQRGYGLSVFEGTEPERFEVEVLGVWREIQPDASYILARLTGRGLESSGVVAGMSGSPVYIEGELAGAVAFAWSFSHEAVGGITPIEAMRDLLAVEPPATPVAARGAAPFELSSIVEGQLSEEVLVEQLARLAPEPLAGAGSGVQWLAAGFGRRSRRILDTALGPLAPAGTAAETPAGTSGGELVPGSSVSGLLVGGDLKLAATGTVTDRLGDRVLAFGHAFLGLGELAVPMARSEVITVLSNQISSFKIANIGEVVGAFDFDHNAGIRGRLGPAPPMVPVTVRLGGTVPRSVDLRVADLPQLAPVLVAVSVLGALDVDPRSSGSEAIDLDARFDLGRHGPLVIRQSFDGPAAPIDMALHLFAVTGYLLQNRMDEVSIESLEVDLGWGAEPRTAEIVGAHAARTRVRPGEQLAVHVDLAAYRGAPFRRTLKLELPAALPAGRYSLLVGDGASIDGARIALERAQPESVEQALELLGSLHSRRELLALGLIGEQGVAVSGEALPRLPGSIFSLWSAAPSGSAQPLNLAIAQQLGTELEMPVSGIVRLDLEVERPQPWREETPEQRNGNRRRNG